MSQYQFFYKDVSVPAGLPGCGTSETVAVPDDRIAIGGGVQLLDRQGTADQIRVHHGPSSPEAEPSAWLFQIDACGTQIHTPDRMVYLRLYVVTVPRE